MKIGPGARPVGMGEAFTGVADDIHAIYWNPAGLGTLKSPEMTGMHMQYFQNIQYEFAAFAYPTQRFGTFGFAVTNLNTDDIDRRTDDTDAAINQFGSSDNAYWVSLTGARSRPNYRSAPTPNLFTRRSTPLIPMLLPVTAEFSTTRIGAICAWGPRFRIWGSKVQFVNESDPLPLTYRLGASAPLFSRRLLVSSDLIIPRDHQVGMAFGGEYKHTISHGIVAVARSGYRTDSDVTGLSGVSAGGGLEVGAPNLISPGCLSET